MVIFFIVFGFLLLLGCIMDNVPAIIIRSHLYVVGPWLGLRLGSFWFCCGLYAPFGPVDAPGRHGSICYLRCGEDRCLDTIQRSHTVSFHLPLVRCSPDIISPD
jgi:hypothetical protein